VFIKRDPINDVYFYLLFSNNEKDIRCSALAREAVQSLHLLSASSFFLTVQEKQDEQPRTKIKPSANQSFAMS